MKRVTKRNEKNTTQATDLLARMQSFSRMKAPDIITYVKANWIKLLVLIASATQTYSLVGYVAPEWAWWLPLIGVLLMEGAVPYWQQFEEMADIADGVKDDVKKNAQERLANVMVWLTILMSAVTMVAGAVIEVADSEKLSKFMKPDAGTTAFLGWLAIIGIFLLGTVHLIAHWQYKRLDPALIIARENRQAVRSMQRETMRAINKGNQDVLKHERREIRQSFRTNAKKMGKTRARKAIKKSEQQK